MSVLIGSVYYAVICRRFLHYVTLTNHFNRSLLVDSDGDLGLWPPSWCKGISNSGIYEVKPDFTTVN